MEERHVTDHAIVQQGLVTGSGGLLAELMVIEIQRDGVHHHGRSGTFGADHDGDAFLGLDIEDERVGSGIAVDFFTEKHQRSAFEANDDLGEMFGEAFAGAEVKRHVRPAPVFHEETEGGESFGVRMRVDAGFLAVAGDLFSIDDAGAVLSADAMFDDFLGFHRADGFEHFDFFVAYIVPVHAARRFHGDEREHAQHVVLHHVAQDAVVVEVAAATFHSEGLGNGDLHAVDVPAVPVRFEDHVGKAEDHDVLHGFFAEVVIDAVNLRFIQDAVQFGVERSGAVEIASERFLDDDTSVAVGRLLQQAGLAEFGGDRSKQRGSDGEIEDDVAAGDFTGVLHLGDFVSERREDIVVLKITGDVEHGGVEFLPFGRIDGVGCELLDVGRHLLTETRVISRRDGHADDGELFRKQTDAAEVEERGDELALGQVAGGAENDEDARCAGAAVLVESGVGIAHGSRV